MAPALTTFSYLFITSMKWDYKYQNGLTTYKHTYAGKHLCVQDTSQNHLFPNCWLFFRKENINARMARLRISIIMQENSCTQKTPVTMTLSPGWTTCDKMARLSTSITIQETAVYPVVITSSLLLLYPWSRSARMARTTCKRNYAGRQLYTQDLWVHHRYKN